jgi:glutamate 5-kinase
VTVVVKFGTSLIAGPHGRVRRSLLRARGREIRAVVRGGEPVCVVSSGAIALGLPRFGLEERPDSLPMLQAASALGQARLQAAWTEALAPLPVAQVLLTAADVADSASYLNAQNALEALFRLSAVPIVNENDATATDEITFGDNDALAAHVAIMGRARLLVLLSEIDGVYSHAPGTPGASLIHDGSLADQAALGDASPLGKGGMRSKVLAAQMAATAGIPTVIASGRGAAVLQPIVAGEERGTRFAAQANPQPSYELWLRFGKPVRGRLVLDDRVLAGAVEERASLFAADVVACEGPFEVGDAVELVGMDGSVLGRGIASATTAEILTHVDGLEAVHHDRLVLYGGENAQQDRSAAGR